MFGKNKKNIKNNTDSFSDPFEKSDPNEPQRISRVTVSTMKRDLADLNSGNFNKKTTITEKYSPAPNREEVPVPSQSDRVMPFLKPKKENGGDALSPFLDNSAESRQPVKNSGSSEQKNDSPSPFINSSKKNSTAEPLSNSPNPLENASSYEKAESKGSKKYSYIISYVLPALGIIIFVIAYFVWIKKDSVSIPDVQDSSQASFVTDDQLLDQKNIVPDQNDTQLDTDEKDSLAPEYLIIETESVQRSDLVSTLKSNSDRLALNASSLPKEFVFTDTNNNPLAFKIFSALTELNLPVEVLEGLDDKFSLFYISDKETGMIRLSVAINLKDSNKIRDVLATGSYEIGFIENFSLFFLDTPVLNTPQNFNSGSYKNHSVRYANLNPDEGLSLDYVVTENHLLIGTSKNALRQLIDEMEQLL